MNLSQAEIDAMLSGGSFGEGDAGGQVEMMLNEFEESLEPGNGGLTSVETDTLGEVGNMCMGAVATTMYTLLDRRVEITTPTVTVSTPEDLLSTYKVPFVIVEVEYIEGILGKNLLLLKETDAALITDVLMGGDGAIEDPIELNELHMSAINEIMNQMIGASATALSQVINSPVNISPPSSRHMTLLSDTSGILDADEEIITITFLMEIEGLLSSQLVQIMPYDQGRALSAMLVSSNGPEPPAPPSETPAPAPASVAAPAPPPPAPAPAPQPPVQAAATQADTYDYSTQQPAPAPAAGYTGYERREPPLPGGLVDVRSMQFESFDNEPIGQARQSGGLDMVSDIPLNVSAELGKASKSLSEVLDFKPGTVIMLSKAAGDPVEVMVNGKLVARGEVVVIDDNYGIRITDLPNS